MANFRYRKVSKYLTPYVKEVLERDNIPYFDFVSFNTTHNEVGVCLTSARFAEVIEDALALEESKRRGCIVVSQKTAKNYEKMKQVNPELKPYLVRQYLTI